VVEGVRPSTRKLDELEVEARVLRVALRAVSRGLAAVVPPPLPDEPSDLAVTGEALIVDAALAAGTVALHAVEIPLEVVVRA
jgi:hypothetical protein